MISGSSLSLVCKAYSAVKSTYTRERRHTKQWKIRNHHLRVTLTAVQMKKQRQASKAGKAKDW